MDPQSGCGRLQHRSMSQGQYSLLCSMASAEVSSHCLLMVDAVRLQIPRALLQQQYLEDFDSVGICLKAVHPDC